MSLITRYDPTRHNTEDVKSLLAMAIGYPTPERIKKIIDVVYDVEGYLLFVIIDKDKITGIIGVDDSASPHGWIIHLAVHPDYRNKGIGRSLISQVMELLSFTSVGLETDQDAVGFYHACGFTAEEIPSKWSGVHRYCCTKGQLPQSVLEYYNNKTLHV
jgi:ribosomal protein S18 acetylase RimI-like enzyme